MESDYRPCTLDNDVTYQQWLAERVKKVKLSLKLISLDPIREESVAEKELE